MKGIDRYRVEGVFCRIGENELPVVNLSVGGFFVATEEIPALLGQSVPLDLCLPRHAPLPMVGLVAWVNHRDQPRVRVLPPGFGVRIQRIGFGEKMAMLAFLRETDPSAARRPAAP